MPASFLSLRLMATTLDDQFVTQACTYKLQIQLHTMVPPVLQHLIFYLSFSISLCLSPFTFSEGVSFSRSLHSAGSHTCSQSLFISASFSRDVPWSEFNRPQESLCYLDLLTPLIRLSTHQIKPGFPSCIHMKGVLLANQLNCWRQISVRERSVS